MNSSLFESDRWAKRGSWLALRERGFVGLTNALKERGFAGVGTYAVRQLRYSLCIALGRRWDREWNIDTGGQVELGELNVVGSNKAMGAPAVSTSPRTFNYLSRYFPADREQVTYIDVGAGKGRTLFLAAAAGFEQVIGVEFSGDLCDVAKDNIASVHLPQERRLACSVVHADATEYEFPTGDLTIFFGNPFSLALWPAMAESLVRSLRKTPRSITIVVTGSEPGTIHGAGQILAAQKEFVRVASGKVPYYLDTYLPYHFECLRSRVATDPNASESEDR